MPKDLQQRKSRKATLDELPSSPKNLQAEQERKKKHIFHPRNE